MPSLTSRYPIWRVREPAPRTYVIALSDLHPVVAQVLYHRNLAEAPMARAFLRGQLDDEDPFHLCDMDRAVERLGCAIAQQESIAVYGDYDVDGVTATALLVETLVSLGARVGHYIPSRFTEGYGLNREALAYLHEHAASVVVTVDCGARASDELGYAKELGLDVIVTDHHELGSNPFPPVAAMINPKRSDCRYPNRELAGVGLAYKLAQALIAELGPAARRNGRSPLPPESLLDLVALGTVADVAPLRGENRTLVQRGLPLLRAAQRPGIRALIEVARLRPNEIGASHIGYALGPRLNAAGRMEHARTSYQLLRSRELQQARVLAQELDAYNRLRQNQTRDMHTLARKRILSEGIPGWILFAADPGFNSGLVGLVASRLTEEFHLPAVVVAIDAEKGQSRGSARSINGFDITATLDACADLLLRYGGHAAAAGFSVENHRLPDLVQRLAEVTLARLGATRPEPVLDIDDRLPLAALDRSLASALAQLEPCGADNRRPVFTTLNLTVHDAQLVGAERTHLRLTVTDGRTTRQAIAWKGADWLPDLSSPIDVAYELESSSYNVPGSVQMVVKDLRPAQ